MGWATPGGCRTVVSPHPDALPRLSRGEGRACQGAHLATATNGKIVFGFVQRGRAGGRRSGGSVKMRPLPSACFAHTGLANFVAGVAAWRKLQTPSSKSRSFQDSWSSELGDLRIGACFKLRALNFENVAHPPDSSVTKRSLMLDVRCSIFRPAASRWGFPLAPIYG